ncbi:MAG TPA: hypothetical protein VN578_21155 [Candidatus Binatia bacterium]|jgi:hypothetical protein|nr:hypothetical protein [Candidatus Binatia bacterium]
MKITLKVLAICLFLLSGGCADLFQDNLDRAYQSGNLSGGEYYNLKAQQEEARRRQMMVYQQQQNAVMLNYMKTINTTPATPMFSTPFFKDRPQGGVQSQSEPRLPSGLALEQMRNGQGATTGRTRLGADGVLWQEYKALDGTMYWVRSR